MFTRSPLRRVLTVLTVSLVGLAPALVVAPAAHAAASALTATAPAAFGDVPVGQVTAQDVIVTNTGGTQVQIDPSMETNVNSLDFLIGPALAPTATIPTCLSFGANSLIPAPIPAGTKCTLGIYFLPTHFGPRSTTMTIVDSVGGSFTLSVSGVGGAGYYLASDMAAWTTFGLAPADLENGPIALASPVVGIAGTSSGDGFWLDASDGGVFTAGSATFLGSMGGRHLNQPIVGMAGTPSDNGYWLVASDGGIFTFGDAGFFGSTGNVRLNKPIVGMASTPSGHGYWLVASDGGIFTFGDAGFYGSTGNVHLQQPIVGMAPSPTGTGYWMVAADGGIFTFNVPFEGSASGASARTVGMALTTAPLFGPFLDAPASTGSQARNQAILSAVKSGRLHLFNSKAAARH